MSFLEIPLTAQPPEIGWVWEGLVPRGYVTLIGALPGQGKTLITTALAWQAARPGGGELLGRRVAPVGALYLDFDAATGTGAAVLNLLARHRATWPDGEPARFHLLEPAPDTYGLDSEKALPALKEAVLRYGVGLVVIDSFMAAFPVDQVKAHAVMPAMYYLRRLAQETGAAVVVVDHLPKPQAGEPAGGRGILGSIAKTAQARAVHVLTRVPPREVAGRHVLRWEVVKNAFAALPDPFVVEIIFQADKVLIQEAELPEGFANPKQAHAERAMLALLNAAQGGVVPKTELVQAAVTAANVSAKTAERYLAALADRLGLVRVDLPGRGNPVGFRLHDTGGNVLKSEEAPSARQKFLVHGDVQNHQADQKTGDEDGGEEWLWF